MYNVKKFMASMRHAGNGLRLIWRYEQNIRIHIALGIVVIVLMFALPLTLWEQIVLVFAISLVLVTEMINSAFERIVDMVKPRLDIYAKQVKDIMAGAVLLTAITAVIVGVLILGPPLLELLGI